MTRPAVVISITSLPSRIGRIRPCLESLLASSVTPDRIILPLPNFSERERSGYTLPDFLKEDPFAKRGVEVIRIERDWGPGTKLIGALSVIKHPSYLVIADHDVRYKPTFLETMLDAQRQEHAA